MEKRTYLAIDLKSFYASVECAARGLDPLTTHLVVADASRTDKTICLAVSPSLKAYGIGGRARLFEVVQRVRQINEERRRTAPGRRLHGSSTFDAEVRANPSLALDYLVATPRMAEYMKVSSRIYGIYLQYVSPEDIHVYSIDEVFIDATEYLKLYKCSAHELAMRMIRDVLSSTGITATAGIGSNLYLAKVAMDIEAKHQPADKDGVRIAELDEIGYRRQLWNHRPLRDFWRVGRGIAAKLEAVGIDTMGRLARASLDPAWEAWLYKMFGINAELLIDHAWGWEPCTMAAIKAYKPSSNSLGSGQVLQRPYTFREARIIALEMTDQLVLDLVEKRLLTDQIVLGLGYDSTSLKEKQGFKGTVSNDWYGRSVPKPAHGSVNLPRPTSSTQQITEAVAALFDRIVDPALLVRHVGVTAAHVVSEDDMTYRQLDLFDERPEDDGRERKRQEAILEIRRKFGKNAILKGMDFEDGATAIERNRQIGGHKA
ncbi:MAG: DNA methylase [Bacteroidales bacterium]|nr:DNA methylase [Bacteroidales bacterium]